MGNSRFGNPKIWALLRPFPVNPVYYGIIDEILDPMSDSGIIARINPIPIGTTGPKISIDKYAARAVVGAPPEMGDAISRKVAA
jgi:hypothetical protein